MIHLETATSGCGPVAATLLVSKVNRVRSLTSQAMPNAASRLQLALFDLRTCSARSCARRCRLGRHSHAETRETHRSPLLGDNSTKSMVPSVTPSVSKGNCPLCGYRLREIEESRDAVILDSQGPAPRCYYQRRPFGQSSLNLHLPSNSTSQR